MLKLPTQANAPLQIRERIRSLGRKNSELLSMIDQLSERMGKTIGSDVLDAHGNRGESIHGGHEILEQDVRQVLDELSVAFVEYLEYFGNLVSWF